MTHHNLKSQNEKLMSLYIDFLPYCETISEKIMLLDEIQELKFKIVKVGQMTVSAAHEQVVRITELKESAMRNY